jgi:hypothetical protein
MKQKLPSAKFFLAALAMFVWLAPSLGASGPKTVVLYEFSGGLDGRSPTGQFIADRAGNLYGTAQLGGINDNGVVFELSPPATKGGKWTETVLYRFQGGADGIAPNPGLVFDSAGNLYGTTFDGGNCRYYCGVVFQLAPPHMTGGSWTETVLHSFGGARSPDGGGPTGSLVLDRAGNLYGTTELGGDVNCTNDPGPCGVVFRLSPPHSEGGQWTETVLYNFAGVPDGQFPFGYLAIDNRGNLVGTTTEGGTGECTDGEGLTIGCGTVFEMSPGKGGTWTETVLYNFQTTDSGSAVDLFRAADGSLFGPAGYDIARLVPPVNRGDPWTKHVLHHFKGGISGMYPSSGLIPDNRGNLYGTTWANAIESQFGTVYELSPPAMKGGKWTSTTLHRFPGNFDSVQPRGRLLRSRTGAIYGAASSLAGDHGYVFEIIP